MSRYGSKTYSRRTECKNSMQFDQLLSENTNKPSTAKVSVAGVHRWGMATFTSIRKNQQNGRSKDGGSLPDDDSNKRMKLSMKADSGSDPFSFESEKDIPPKNTAYVPPSSSVSVPPDGSTIPLNTQSSRPNKFFKSGGLRPLAQQNAARKQNTSNVPSKESTAPRKQLSMDSFTTTRARENSPKPLMTEISVVKPQTKDPFDSLFGDVNIGSSSASEISDKLKLDEHLSCLSVGSHSENNMKSQDLPGVAWQVRDTSDKMEVSQPSESQKSEIDDVEIFFSAKPLKKTTENMFSVENLLKNSTPSYSVNKSNPSEAPSQGAFRTYSRNSKPYDPTNFESPNCSLIVSNNSASLPSDASCTPDMGLNEFLSPHLPDTPLSQVLDKQLTQLSDTPLSQTSELDQPLSQLSDPPLSQLTLSSTTDSQELASCSEGFTDLSQENKESFNINDDSSLKANYTKALFKSRKIFNSPKKMKAVYKVRAWHEEDKEETNLASQDSETTKSLADEFDEEGEGALVVDKLILSKKISRVNSLGESVTSWRCDREVKQLYTVVHNVKQAHQCHESGETQEFNDDVEYLLEGVQLKSSLGTRCLSTLGWASKCMTPSFRIHLRAHGTIPRVFSALMDAPANPSLSLCTATLMFVLSQDRLTMDLEASTLSLMLQLLECKVGEVAKIEMPKGASQTISPHQADKIKEKVRSLCEQMQQKGYAQQLDLNNITGGILAMETLLSLSSRRTGEWFKEEIRALGGLDYIVDTVKTDVDDWCNQVTVERVAGIVLEKLRKIDRCLRVIEKVTYMDQENQAHLLQGKNIQLVTSCIELLEKCRISIAFHPIEQEGDAKNRKKNDTPGGVLFACTLTLLKVLFNLTHENAVGSTNIGGQEGFIDLVLLLLMETPIYVPLEQRFDLLVMALSLLINMVELCEANRDKLVLSRTVGCYDSEKCGSRLSGVEALVEVFLNRLELAKQSEEQADALLDSQSEEPEPRVDGEAGESQQSSQANSQQSQVDRMEETLMKALQKAGKHMEHSIIAAYIALILGCIIQNSDYSNMIRDFMPNGNFQAMIEILKKFVDFVNLTGMSSSTGMKSVERVLAILESS